MSAHLNRDSLWELATALALPAPMQAHLATCGDCQVQLAQVRQAQSLLQLRAAPPPLNPIAMRRIGAVLKEAAEQQAESKSWFRGYFGFALAGAAGLFLAFFVWRQVQVAPSPLPEPIAKKEEVAPPQPPPTQLAEKPAPPAVVEARPLIAKVTSSRKASSAGSKLLKAQTVAQGSKVTTEAGGALWLALPDGSRAGLTGNTQLAIDTLEDKALSFTLEKGDVVMVARHLPERMMTVKAGEIEVRDIGTRFLVSRDIHRVIVAVEEGVVEINAPGSRTTLKAGRSVEWREGQLREQAWAPAPVVTKKVVAAVSPPTPAIEPLVVDAGTAADDDWASPPAWPAEDAGSVPTLTPPPMTNVEDEPPIYDAPAPAEDEEGSVLSLAGIEKRVKRLVQAPFNAVGSTIRETRSREIGRLADEGACDEALKKADAWLADKPSVSNLEPRWRHTVMVNQMRCYTRLKRMDDAARIKAKLEQ